MAKHYSNVDKILQAVLANEKLSQWGEYEPTGEETISEALSSSNPTIRAVAMIIDGEENNSTQKEVYTQLTQFLTQAL
jgi:hypothetical protein